MPIARVSIACVEKFQNAMQNALDSLRTAMNSANSVVNQIDSQANVEISRLNSCLSDCNSAMSDANDKLSDLRSTLQDLNAELSVTPETITEEVPDGYDEDGNITYTTIEVPNPAYYSLLSEISAVESQISTLDSLISDLQSKIDSINNAISTIQQAISVMNECRNEISECGGDVMDKSESADIQLNRAKAAIQKYLDVTVHISPVPSHTSIGWSTYSSGFDIMTSARADIVHPARTYDDRFTERTTFYGIAGKHYAESQYSLLSEQGTAKPDYRGTCGLVSSANILRQLGVCKATEDDLLNRALELKACREPSKHKTGGGTNNNDIVKIMKSYNLQATKVQDLSIKNITDCLNKGGAMMMSVRSKYLRDGASIPDRVSFKKNTDHFVTVTGVKKDNISGAVLGVFVQDSGGHNSESNIFISTADFDKMRKISNDFTGIAVFKKEEL